MKFSNALQAELDSRDLKFIQASDTDDFIEKADVIGAAALT